MSIESYPNPNGVLTSLIWRKTMSGAETSLSGYDNASQALSYTPGQEQVYLNGILLVRGDDYLATTGTTITGLSALSASDYVQVNCYNNFSVASLPAQNITGTVTNAQLANSAITINGSAISLGGTVTLAGDIESVTATSPLTGGGSTGALTVGIQDASTAQKGSVQLSDSTSTTSSILAATPTAVKSAYDLANAAIPKTLTTTTGDIIYASSANTPARLGIGSTGQSLVVASGIPSWATPASGTTFVGAKAYKGSGQSVATATQTLMSWDQSFYDTNSIHDESGQPSRFTVPSGKHGYWLVQCHIGWPASSGTIFHEAVVFKNGAVFPNPNSTTTFYGVGFTGRSHQVDISEIMYLSAADFIQFYVQQNSGGTVNTTHVHTQATWASITFLGA